MSPPSKPPRILISAGEASGDLYASQLVKAVRTQVPEAEFFGCAGHRMLQEGVEAVVDAHSLSVVGIVEVVTHLPRIYGEFRKLVRAARERRPDLAVLTDSPDFHFRLLPHFKKLGVPVVYLVAPQAWAWRKGRIPFMKRNIDRLLCIFPFEEPFFRSHGVNAEYIGHPLARLVRPSLPKDGFFRKHRLSADRPLVAVLPGSREGELRRHLPALWEAVEYLNRRCAASFMLGLPAGRDLPDDLRLRMLHSPFRVCAGETWDLLAHADVALAASGTVAMEAALLGTPMVTYYRVSPLTWLLGRRLVNVPFFTMVNLVAGRQVVPELIQDQMTGERVAEAALELLGDPAAANRMRQQLQELRGLLLTGRDPMERAAEIVVDYRSQGVAYGA
jgi:lipid-A-disaccharide synthase